MKKDSMVPYHSVYVRFVPFLILALATGCSDSDRMQTAPVKGVVTYKGKPVPNGTIMFMPSAGGKAATGELDKEGRFELTTYSDGDGAVLGSHDIAVVALEEMKDVLPEQRSGLPKPLVPDKYLSHTTSGLKFDVKPEGDKNAKIELK
jgi:hypothetical protein